jgi:hypothetical protein
MSLPDQAYSQELQRRQNSKLGGPRENRILPQANSCQTALTRH